jgi:hypothetical protein
MKSGTIINITICIVKVNEQSLQTQNFRSGDGSGIRAVSSFYFEKGDCTYQQTTYQQNNDNITRVRSDNSDNLLLLQPHEHICAIIAETAEGILKIQQSQRIRLLEVAEACSRWQTGQDEQLPYLGGNRMLCWKCAVVGKWVFAKKINGTTGEPCRYKARWDSEIWIKEIEEIDLNELFAAVAHGDSIWENLAHINDHDMHCDQVDNRALSPER